MLQTARIWGASCKTQRDAPKRLDPSDRDISCRVVNKQNVNTVDISYIALSPHLSCTVLAQTEHQKNFLRSF